MEAQEIRSLVEKSISSRETHNRTGSHKHALATKMYLGSGYSEKTRITKGRVFHGPKDSIAVAAVLRARLNIGFMSHSPSENNIMRMDPGNWICPACRAREKESLYHTLVECRAWARARAKFGMDGTIDEAKRAMEKVQNGRELGTEVGKQKLHSLILGGIIGGKTIDRYMPAPPTTRDAEEGTGSVSTNSDNSETLQNGEAEMGSSKNGKEVPHLLRVGRFLVWVWCQRTRIQSGTHLLEDNQEESAAPSPASGQSPNG